MSDHSHATAVPEAERFDLKRVGAWPKLLAIAGAVGIVASLFALVSEDGRKLFAHSWLFAFTYFFTLCVGGLFWTCLHHATDAEWSVVVRRQLENIASLLPWFALLFLPLLFVPHHVWHWWDLDPHKDPLLLAKQPYLSQPFFYLRLIAYFGLLGWLALSLRGRSTKQDKDGSAKHTFVMRKFGIAGIPAIAVCLTFAAVDWLMGLDYHWFSTMWGVYIFAGAAGSSMALLVVIVTTLRDKGYLKVVTLEHYHVMGKFLLAFTVFWAYIGYSQYMLIWYANIPEETIYFRIRNTESWWYLSTALVLGRFFFPFPVLLLQAIKKTPIGLRNVSIWILVMQLLDIFLVVLPMYHKQGVTFGALAFSILPLVGIGSVLGWLFLKRLGQDYMFPTRDPRLAASINLTN